MSQQLEEDAVAAARAWCAGAPVEVHEQIGSTNDRVAALAEEGAPEGTLVVARQQLAGRGRHGRTFASPPGGLYCSFLLRPEEDMLRRLPPTLVGGMALCQGLDAVLPSERRALRRWPNDVLLEGRKLGGILGEMTKGADGYRLVLGVGINLDPVEFPEELEGIAIALGEVVSDVDPVDVLGGFFGAFSSLYGSVQRGGGALILAQASGRMPQLGKAIRLVLPNGDVVEGVFSGLSATGGLVLESSDGTRRETHLAGEVEQVRGA